MTRRKKTAAIATGANVILTLAKFGLYFFTGSLAILAEAWHSLTDIGTSALVWLALHRQDRHAPEGPAEGPEEESASTGWRARFARLRGALSAETIASVCIGLMLLVVSLRLFQSVFSPQAILVANPLIAGILFFLFGVSSYMVFKFETQIGIEERSVGLTSDGMHSKSDMIASFLTGASLIAYHFGFDIDRPVGFFIALLIFLLALEVFLLIISNKEIGEDAEVEFKSQAILTTLFDPETLRRVPCRRLQRISEDRDPRWYTPSSHHCRQDLRRIYQATHREHRLRNRGPAFFPF